MKRSLLDTDFADIDFESCTEPFVLDALFPVGRTLILTELDVIGFPSAVIDAPGIENIASLLAISIYVKVILLLDAAVPFTICVLLCWERLGPINTSKPFIEAIRKSLTFKLLTVYDNLN